MPVNWLSKIGFYAFSQHTQITPAIVQSTREVDPGKHSRGAGNRLQLAPDQLRFFDQELFRRAQSDMLEALLRNLHVAGLAVNDRLTQLDENILNKSTYHDQPRNAQGNRQQVGNRSRPLPKYIPQCKRKAFSRKRLFIGCTEWNQQY